MAQLQQSAKRKSSWLQKQSEILCVPLRCGIGTSLPTGLSYLYWYTGREVRRLRCVTPSTVYRDQILEISATRLHILRLQTRVTPGCCHGDVIDFMPAENSFLFSFISEPHTLKTMWYHTCWGFPLLYFPFLVGLFSVDLLSWVCVCVCFQVWCTLGMSFARSMETW